MPKCHANLRRVERMKDYVRQEFVVTGRPCMGIRPSSSAGKCVPCMQEHFVRPLNVDLLLGIDIQSIKPLHVYCMSLYVCGVSFLPSMQTTMQPTACLPVNMHAETHNEMHLMLMDGNCK